MIPFRQHWLKACALVVSLAAAALAGSGPAFELRGKVTGGDGATALRVQLFSVETPFTDSAAVGADGAFQFRDLAPGNYTVALVREGVGEIRRTVVITGARADADGVVRAEIPYSSSEAALGEGAATVSLAALAVPEPAREKYRQAEQRLTRHDAGGAVALLEESVSLAPQFADAWNALGVIAFQQGDSVAAERGFRRAVEGDANAFDSVVNLGGLLLRSGRAAEALVYNQRAAADRPLDALARAQLGMNYFQLGRMQEAEEHLRAAQRIDPAQYMQPQLFLAEIYRQRGDRAAALGELQDLLAARPDDSNAAAVRAAIAKLQD